ncbi:DUF1499 domain-containing protein [Roseitranquillus sediminis]|uniref:DUF1499 domain-containing protein n=1 Tax=Roseitranquillus sediminis TaxID=2809051 RepID=UPI001D0C7B6C|nr:DUF1499 domain-containing protein [Roseitranquillus sediminis]MBM9594362.1 DUF1499 domain-containing protein [Roseitranquillus sediminis]
MWWTGLVALGVAVGLAGWVRLAPANPPVWHVDPLTAERPGGRGWLVRPEGGDQVSPAYPVSLAELLAAIDRAALAEPRTRRIAGSVEEGRMTYESRSRIFGFPDFTTVAAIADGEGARPVLLGRARFGSSDLGVNRARIERWLVRLE